DHELTAAPRVQGYRIPRRLIIFGQHVDYGGSWQAPLRLFRRTLARYTDVPVHEKVVLSEGKITLMRSGLHHPTYRDYQHALQKFVDYAWLQAGARWNRGRRSSMTGAALRAAYNFIYNYFIRFGFLDGAHGFVLAALHAQYTFNKYAPLWAMEQEPHTAPPAGGEGSEGFERVGDAPAGLAVGGTDEFAGVAAANFAALGGEGQRLFHHLHQRIGRGGVRGDVGVLLDAAIQALLQPPCQRAAMRPAAMEEVAPHHRPVQCRELE